MSGSSSESSSSSSTEQTNEDNKVTATDGSIALAKDASFSYVNQLGPEAQKVVEQAFNLAKEAGLVALGLHEQTVQFQNAALEAAASRAERAEEIENLKDQIVFKDILPWLVGGVVALGFVQTLRRR